MRALTKKQEAFAVAVAKGETGADAYRAAYDAKKMSPETLHKRVGELLKHGGIAGCIAELRAPALEAAGADVERWIRETAKYAFAEPSDDLKHADKRGYLDMMGKSLGAYEKDNAQQRDNLVLNVEQARPIKR